MSKNVLVVGTGTIGEPLIGLFSVLKSQMGIDNLYFHKRTPLRYEVAKVNSLINRGAKLVTDKQSIKQFEDLGHKVECDYEQALKECDVIVDCTPAGNKNKEAVYLDLSEEYPNKTFIAQGSETDFGLPYAYGINDTVLKSGVGNLRRSPEHRSLVQTEPYMESWVAHVFLGSGCLIRTEVVPGQ